MPTKEEIISFSDIIEELTWTHDITHMEAILWHCDKTGLEVEVAATLISKPLKAKIEEGAQKLNLIPKVAKLPI